nr:unnamed protein product [Spirometra erinaceieuropaei]
MLLVSCLVCCTLSMKTPRCFDSDEDAVNYVMQKVFQCTGTSDRRLVLCDLGFDSGAQKHIQAAVSLPHHDLDWLAWKHRLNISFYTIEEEFYRHGVWRKNVEFIKQHNAKYAAGSKLYRMRENQFTHMEHWEFVERHLRSRIEETTEFQDEEPSIGNETLAMNDAYVHGDCTSTPMDWRLLSSGSTAKNQGECGACWAFASAAVIEWHWAIETNSTLSVSRQQMVDCVESNFGCNGGLIENALAYAQSSGLMSAADYPYRFRVTQCKYDPTKLVLRPKGFEKLNKLKETSLTCVLKERGPIVIGLDASGRGLQHYHTGLFTDLDCDAEYLNHAVVLVGYGVDAAGRSVGELRQMQMHSMVSRSFGIILLFLTCTWGQNVPVDTNFDFYLRVWKGIAEIVPDIFSSTENVNCTIISETSTVSTILACVKEMACTLTNSSVVDANTPLGRASATICEQPQPVTGIPQASLEYLRDSVLSKAALMILIQSYTRQITVDPPSNDSVQLVVKLAQNITALPTKAKINFTEYQHWSLKAIIENQTTLVPTDHVFLSAYDDFFAEMASILNNTYISANMPARNAYAPIIRNDPDIKFIDNNNDALAAMVEAILRQSNNDLVLIYNDPTVLDFLTRQMKALYYTTLKLDPDWEQNLERLKSVFKRKVTTRSYVMLLSRETLKETANRLLNYALIQQQLRKGIEWILFSLDFRCNDVFTDFKNTGATLYCFAQSNVFTPTEPLQVYTPKQTLAAKYIDALTYITTRSTMPNDYILQRLLFQGVQPYANNVDSIAIFDCSSDDTQAVGSWQPSRSQPLMLTPAITTLQGRSVNVGFIQYGPFYDVFSNNGLGFSVALMQEVSRRSGIQINPLIYPSDSSRPFGQRLEEEISAGNIYFGATPIALNASVSVARASGLVLPTDFSLLRRKPSPTPDFILILRPFAMPIWLASVLLGAIFTAILAVYDHFTPAILKRLAEGQGTSTRDVFEMASLGVVSAFSIAKLPVIPSHLSSRMFTLFMWLFAILLIVIYSCGMMTILLRIRSPKNSDTDPYGLIAATNADDLLLIKNGIGYDSLLASLQNNTLVSGYTTVNSLDEAFANVIGNEKKVLLASSIETSYLNTNSCDLETIPYPSISQVLLSFPISMSWEFADDIDNYLLATSDSGVFEEAGTIYFETGRCFIPTFKVAEPTTLDIGGAASLFLLLLIGILVSFICLGIEITIRHFKNKQDHTELVFGQVYNATVTALK